ncbi:MAG TPA: hypothetical protein VJV78_14650 [Polyangiales bacterium]|nr:hypothetical protein [Polyangiales bacterium]
MQAFWFRLTCFAMAVCAVCATRAAAQAAQPPARSEENVDGRAAFLIGVSFFDLGELNDRLASADYSRLDGAMTVIGGEGHVVLENGFMAGGMGAAVIGPSGEGPNNLDTDFSGGFGMADLGFALVHTPSVLFGVLGNIGGYGWSLSIDTPGSASFARVLEDPTRGTRLERSGVFGGATLMFEGRVPVGQIERNHQGFFSLGVRVSGLWGPPMGSWSLPDGSDTTSDPDTGMAGFFAALTLGFGGRPVKP